jgi:ATP-dependent Lhr-like helicase
MRLQPYWGDDLDRLCSSGRLTWLRLAPPLPGRDGQRRNPVLASTPIAFVARPHLAHWRAFTPLPELAGLGLSGAATRVHGLLESWGASFCDELRVASGLLPAQIETALGELAALGLLGADSFQGLRTLITPARSARRSGRRQVPDAAGRWSLLRPLADPGEGRHAHVEHVARTLLRRYGVVFRALADREQGLPAWRELLYVYRRLEARGELRGGRFVHGFAGEQYALPDALGTLRKVRKQPCNGELVVVSTADPAHLATLITPGLRESLGGRLVLYRDGVAVAAGRGRDITFIAPLDPPAQWAARNRLAQRGDPGGYHAPPPGP